MNNGEPAAAPGPAPAPVQPPVQAYVAGPAPGPGDSPFSLASTSSRTQKTTETEVDKSFASFFDSFTECEFYSYTDTERKHNLTRDKLTEMGYVDSTKLQAALGAARLEDISDDGDGDASAQVAMGINKKTFKKDLKCLRPNGRHNWHINYLEQTQAKLIENSEDTSEIDKWIALINKYMDPNNLEGGGIRVQSRIIKRF